MKCDVLSHEFKDAENGNRYCKLEVRPSGDEFARTFNYVMFVTEAMEEALEAKFPKFIYLQELKVKTPEPFYRFWATDGPGHTAGEMVTRPNRENPDDPTPIVFTEINVIIRTLPNGEPARGEDAEKLAESSYYRGISNGTIVPVSEYGDYDGDDSSTGSDPFNGATSAGDEIPEEPEEKKEEPTKPSRPTGRPGVTVRK